MAKRPTATVPRKKQPRRALGYVAEKMRETHKYATLGKLTAGIVHEIRNPLSVLSLSLDTISRQAPHTQAMADALGHAHASVDRMHRIIAATLEYAREAAPSNHVLDLRALIADTLPLVTTTVKGKSIEFRSLLGKHDIPPIRGDRGLLQQVFINLLTNAVESIAHEGVVAIDARARKGKNGREIVVKITDTGSGIAKADLPNVFTLFFTRKKTGTGLGLAITRSILDKHGATIAVSSTRGKGTTFTIVFPPAEAAPEHIG